MVLEEGRWIRKAALGLSFMATPGSCLPQSSAGGTRQRGEFGMVAPEEPFCHLPCFGTALYLLYPRRNALLGWEGSRITWGKGQSWRQPRARHRDRGLHMSNHGAATDKEDEATQVLYISPFFPHTCKEATTSH